MCRSFAADLVSHLRSPNLPAGRDSKPSRSRDLEIRYRRVSHRTRAFRPSGRRLRHIGREGRHGTGPMPISRPRCPRNRGPAQCALMTDVPSWGGWPTGSRSRLVKAAPISIAIDLEADSRGWHLNALKYAGPILHPLSMRPPRPSASAWASQVQARVHRTFAKLVGPSGWQDQSQ
jgi:hypothetical protein